MLPVLAHSDKPSVDEVPNLRWSEQILALSRPGRPRRLNNPFRDFDGSPEVIACSSRRTSDSVIDFEKSKMSSPRSFSWWTASDDPTVAVSRNGSSRRLADIAGR